MTGQQTPNTLLSELRSALKSGKGIYSHRLLCGQAADEIERLQALLAMPSSADQPPSEGHYVEELRDGHWTRCALGHLWGTETDARTQLEELRRRYGSRVFRLHGDSSQGE